ncbi:N-(5'-phosphoribosyl)anthranilate isomerase [Sporotomaculum syntrophicum]|uniref:N-(5'-phosphoribosyl)anthranilate isomerase n=1 Tax=Sporotomaculum syntrophicum TaxID=182264 RepID=A0A9D2WQB6_9FIRM|nr:phosphoribosylanthranilate isomerase [Sporotomaculum syntrophicum]KAF1085143.1 N-(5'-phosphoribosyl)anthranilate isomerase [Sporotomaculum syntrophicum]
MTRVKICGLMNRRDINLCVRAGVHMLGFVVEYPIPVPWNLTPAKARELIGQVPPFVGTCIVTGGSCEKVLTLVSKTNPNVVQLHYQETLAEIKELARRLKIRGIKTIKALRIDSNGQCDFEISDPATAARVLAKTGIAAILVDSYTNSMPGGTGVRVDLATFKTIQQESSLPVILAGGLNPTNILPIIQKIHPFAVDVLTGVENKPGEKDPEKIERFMQSIQYASKIKKKLENYS